VTESKLVTEFLRSTPVEKGQGISISVPPLLPTPPLIEHPLPVPPSSSPLRREPPLDNTMLHTHTPTTSLEMKALGSLLSVELSV